MPCSGWIILFPKQVYCSVSTTNTGLQGKLLKCPAKEAAEGLDYIVSYFPIASAGDTFGKVFYASGISLTNFFEGRTFSGCDRDVYC